MTSLATSMIPTPLDIELVAVTVPKTPNESNSTSQTGLQLVEAVYGPVQKEHVQDVSRPSQTFTIIKSVSKNGKTKTVTRIQPKLLNNLLISVGFLDLASACDFPANIWNDYPVPIYAEVFMVLGGLFALTIACFAARDFRLSYPNYTLLLAERQFLKLRRSQRLQEKGSGEILDLDSCLEVNFRELGNEVARLGMDVVMGFGVFLVGIGTLMAPGGSHPRVFHASNLLSGYIGNAPIASYGLMNSAWSIYLYRKTYQHSLAGREVLKSTKAGKLLEHRTRLLKLYCAVYGVAGFFTGVGSLISATMWFGYVISLPWIFLAVFCNWLYRTRIGYDRPTIQEMDVGMGNFLTKDSLICEIANLDAYRSMVFPKKSRRRTLRERDASNRNRRQQARTNTPTLSAALLQSKPANEILDLLVRYDLFNNFCHALLTDGNEALFVELESSGLILVEQDTRVTKRGRGFETITTITIDSEKLVAAMADQKFQNRLLELASKVVDDCGFGKLRQRRRFLVEILGCVLYNSRMGESERESEAG